ncbi:hypothetical protein KHA94_23700 [Bacillus sp. FJAT-49705]|uniref:Transcriptional regulator n=1 Tax=Cytobacillus citreus TaxID=2833586 RepID=A0ABS5NZV0_9BACI|nr:hypothetical protein [Cytobacillus citreus]MBS4193116.1 hypothetical protein [Cytobacillus citreus]
MKRKIFNIIFVFTLSVTGVFWCITAQASASENLTLQEVAPDTIFVEGLYYYGQEKHYFYSTSAYGEVYRGYVSK